MNNNIQNDIQLYVQEYRGHRLEIWGAGEPIYTLRVPNPRNPKAVLYDKNYRLFEDAIDHGKYLVDKMLMRAAA